MGKCGLKDRRNGNDAVARVLQMLCCLPRLPAKFIAQGYDEARKEAQNIDDTRDKVNVMRFLSYFHNTWILGYAVEDLTLYQRSVFTTSGQESLHSLLNGKKGRAVPTFWVFYCKCSFRILF